MCIDASELVPMSIVIPIPCPLTTSTVVESMCVILLVHHPFMAVGAGLGSHVLRDEHDAAFCSTVVAEHVDRTGRTALDSRTPGCITNEQNTFASDELER